MCSLCNKVLYLVLHNKFVRSSKHKKYKAKTLKTHHNEMIGFLLIFSLFKLPIQITMLAYNKSQNNMLILQESCIDSSGSLVIYSPMDLPAINIALSGEDTTYIPLLPSDFTISSDGRQGQRSNEASCNITNNGTMGDNRSGDYLLQLCFKFW